MIDAPELEVLAAAAASDRERQRGRLPILLEACDPERLIAETQRHAMGPVLCGALEGLAVEDGLWARISAVAAADRALSARLAEGLARIVRSAAGKRIVAVKGPALGVLAWGDATARASRDLDLWAPEGRVPADVPVDWEDRLAVGVPWTVVVEVAGEAVETPSPEDAALILCATTEWKLGRIADLIALLRITEASRLAARALETGLSAALERGLELAQEPRRWTAPSRLERLRRHLTRG